jgi:hypothetical protein
MMAGSVAVVAQRPLMIGGRSRRDKCGRPVRVRSREPREPGCAELVRRLPSLGCVAGDPQPRPEGPFTMRVSERFLGCLPVRGLPPRPEGQPLGVRRPATLVVSSGRSWRRRPGAVLGLLGYYLPVYRAPELFPAVTVTVPWLGRTMRLPWGELGLGRPPHDPRASLPHALEHRGRARRTSGAGCADSSRARGCRSTGFRADPQYR